MRAVVQRVKFARVRVEGKIVAEIGYGLLVFLGIGKEDGEGDIYWLANKIINLRIFEDKEGKFNLSLLDIKGQILLVSQFTLYADCRKGRRPSFDSAMDPEQAREIFEKFYYYLKAKDLDVHKGIFGLKMDIESTNYGPVTILIET